MPEQTCTQINQSMMPASHQWSCQTVLSGLAAGSGSVAVWLEHSQTLELFRQRRLEAVNQLQRGFDGRVCCISDESLANCSADRTPPNFSDVDSTSGQVKLSLHENALLMSGRGMTERAQGGVTSASL